MNCADAKRLLQDRLDGLPILDDDLEGHLVACADCRGLHAAAGQLLKGLALMPALTAPAHLHSAIVGEVLADRTSRLVYRRRLLAITAMAAGLLLVITTLWLQQGADSTVIVTNPTPNAVEPLLPKQASLRASFTEAGEALVSLTRRTADETVGQTRLLIPESIPAPLPVPEDVPVLDTTAQVWSGAGQGMSTGLQPLATSARRAFSMLLRENPDEKR